MDVDFYVKVDGVDVLVDDVSKCSLVIYKNPNSRRASAGIVTDVINIITDAFNKNNIEFGQMIDINQIATDIVNVEGVDEIKTYRSDTDTYVDGLSFLIWNDAYPKLDANSYTRNYKLQYFQYPLFNNLNNLISRINVIEPTGVIQITDF
jgi:hypothetical protein